MLRRFFRFGELGANFHTEFIAGTTTFLAMAYIIMVNPAILSDAGMPKDALITATILASAFGTLLGGLWANVPYAMAPGMGINAFFAYTLVLGHNVTWQTALGVVFISGVFFLILTITGVRKMFVKAIPKHLRLGIAAGIGLFITFIGLQKLNIIVANKATMVGLGKVDMKVILGMVGLIVMMVLSVRKMRGAVLTGIVFTTLLGVLLGEVAKPSSWVAMPPSLALLFLKLDIVAAFRWGLIGAIFSFMFVDLFDSIGSVVACAYEAGFVEKDGTIPHVQKILMADAMATVVGTCLGTSTTTLYIESGAGIADGGRSGFTSVVTAFYFLAALFIAPVIAIVPTFAIAPALIVVGVFMFTNVGEIDFSDFKVAAPAFLTMIVMPLSYSISMGLCFGFISYILVAVAAGEIKKIHPIMWCVGALSVGELYLQMRPVVAKVAG